MNHGKKTFLLALASAVVLSGCSGSGQQMTAYDAQYLERMKQSLNNIKAWQKTP